MKNTIKFFGIIALVAVIGFSMAACGGGGGGDGDGGGGSAALGDTLSLSGQVYEDDIDIESISSGGGSLIKYTSYTSSVPSLTSNVGGTGKITSGKMTFTVGTPSSDKLKRFDEDGVLDSGDYDESEIYKDMKVTPGDARGIGLEIYNSTNKSKSLDKLNMNFKIKDSAVKVEMVLYVYADKDCTITAKGGTATDPDTGYKVKASDVKLNLKEGWNVMNLKTDVGISKTGSLSLKTGDLSSCKWVYGSTFTGGDWSAFGDW